MMPAIGPFADCPLLDLTERKADISVDHSCSEFDSITPPHSLLKYKQNDRLRMRLEIAGIFDVSARKAVGQNR